MLSQQKKELLVCGFVRLNYNGVVPYDVIIMFGEWMNNTLYINLSGDSLQKLLTNKPFKSNHIIELTNNISLKCIIHSNMEDVDRFLDHDHDKTRITLELIPKIPSNMECLEFYVESGCEQIINSLLKQTTRYSLSVEHYTHTIALLSECKNKLNYKDKLTFYVSVELISIQYKSNKTHNNIINNPTPTQKIYLIESPIFKSQIKYEWIIDNEAVTQFKCCELNEFVFSQNFGDNCISFFLTPTGWTNISSAQTSEYVRLGLEFYKLPNKVDYISVNIELKTNLKKINGDFMTCQETQDVECGNAVFFFWNSPELTAKKIRNAETLVFNVDIEITGAFIGNMDEGGIPIDKSEWVRFGITQ